MKRFPPAMKLWLILVGTNLVGLSVADYLIIPRFQMELQSWAASVLLILIRALSLTLAGSVVAFTFGKRFASVGLIKLYLMVASAMVFAAVASFCLLFVFPPRSFALWHMAEGDTADFAYLLYAFWVAIFWGGLPQTAILYRAVKTTSPSPTATPAH